MSLLDKFKKVEVVATKVTTKQTIDLLTVKKFLQIEAEDTEDDMFIETIVIPSAISVVSTRTGIPESELINYSDLKPAMLLLCSQFYDDRSGMTSSQVRENPIIASLLNSRRRNLI